MTTTKPDFEKLSRVPINRWCRENGLSDWLISHEHFNKVQDLSDKIYGLIEHVYEQGRKEREEDLYISKEINRNLANYNADLSEDFKVAVEALEYLANQENYYKESSDDETGYFPPEQENPWVVAERTLAKLKGVKNDDK